MGIVAHERGGVTLHFDGNSSQAIETDPAIGPTEDEITGSETQRLKSSNGLIIKDHSKKATRNKTNNKLTK